MRFFERDTFLINYCQGKRVLHLGCLGFTELPVTERVRRFPETLHWRLCQVADVMGVDNATDVIMPLRAAGLGKGIVDGDIQVLPLSEFSPPYDVILIADVIEHLSNPGLMLARVRLLCSETTRVLITTPHAFGLLNYLRYIAGRFHEGRDHVMTFNAQNLCHLLERHGFLVESVDTCFQTQPMRAKWLTWLGCRFFARFPQVGGTLLLRVAIAIIR